MTMPDGGHGAARILTGTDLDGLDIQPTDDPGIVEVAGLRYRIEITGEAEVVPGPISRIRQLCLSCIESGQALDPKTVLTIMEEAGV